MSNGIAHPDPPFRLATVVECSSGPAVRTVSFRLLAHGQMEPRRGLSFSATCTLAARGRLGWVRGGIGAIPR